MKRFLQILLMFVSVIALNSCEDYMTFRVFEFDDSKTTATNITENSVTLNCQVIQTEKGNFGINGKDAYRLYMVIADYPEYFEGVTTSSGWKAYYCLSTFVIDRTYSANFKGLKPNTTYYYAPIVPTSQYDDYNFEHRSIGENIIRGEVKSFTTPKHLYTKNEYLGTYTMTYRMDENSGVQTWNNVKIGKTTTGEMYLQNLPPYGYTAYGYWVEKDGIIKGSSEFYSEDDVSTYEGYQVAPIFTPVYYDASKNEYYDALIDGFSYINFVMTENGVIKMTPTETAGSNGYRSNAFVWIVYRISTWKAIATSSVIYDVTLTKQ